MNPEEQERQKIEKRYSEANAEIEKVLLGIFKKDIHFLTVEDKRFLQARRSYLTKHQLEEYDAVLKEKLPRPDGQEDKEEEEQLETMVRKDLEAMALRLGIEDPSPKVYKKNSDLIEAIKEKQKELDK